jgi:hypothetical protein
MTGEMMFDGDPAYMRKTLQQIRWAWRKGPNSSNEKVSPELQVAMLSKISHAVRKDLNKKEGGWDQREAQALIKECTELLSEYCTCKKRRATHDQCPLWRVLKRCENRCMHALPEGGDAVTKAMSNSKKRKRPRQR